jgi:two-component system response regulator
MATKPILLVEDNPDDEELIRLALKDNQIANDVVVTRDGVEALDYLFATGRYAGRELTKPPALVLLDLKLPKVSGLDVLKRVREDPRTRMIPIVILTSSNEEQDIVASYQLGTNSYVRKPIDFHEFQKVVKEIGLYWLLVNQPPILE